MKRFLPLVAGLVLPLAFAAQAHDGKHAESHRQIAGPADDYVYQLAEPGTYALPPIGPAADARLLDAGGTQQTLTALYKGRITLLTFFYTRCGDVCPMAALRMADLQLLASERPAVAAALQLVSLSFDPAHDTPARLADFAQNVRMPGIEAPSWLFLTAPSPEAIAPVLQAYGQPIAVKADPADPTGPFSHLLRVFLIDREGVIRNIYSADFLDPRLVLNDVETLLLDRRPGAATSH